MRNLLRQLLSVFTASLSRVSDLVPLSARNKALTHEAILCVRYITDFILLVQYQVHTTGSIQSMNDYLQDFHINKEVFLCFRAGKAVKSQAKAATQQFMSKHSLEASGAYTTSNRQKLNEE